MGLTSEQITALLKKSARPQYTAPQQRGVLRWVDKSMRCASRGCSSPTYCKVEGVPYCTKHSLEKLNELVLELTNEKLEVIQDGNSG